MMTNTIQWNTTSVIGRTTRLILTLRLKITSKMPVMDTAKAIARPGVIGMLEVIGQWFEAFDPCVTQDGFYIVDPTVLAARRTFPAVRNSARCPPPVLCVSLFLLGEIPCLNAIPAMRFEAARSPKYFLTYG